MTQVDRGLTIVIKFDRPLGLIKNLGRYIGASIQRRELDAVAGGRSAGLGATPPPSITPASRARRGARCRRVRAWRPVSPLGLRGVWSLRLGSAASGLSAWAPRPHMAGSMAGRELEEGLQRRKLDSPATWELDLPAPRGSIVTAWELHRDGLLYGGSLSSGGLPLSRRSLLHKVASPPSIELQPVQLPDSFLRPCNGLEGKGEREVGATGGAGGATFFGSLPPQPRQRARFPAAPCRELFYAPV
jgi:hypothetical protein